MGVDATIAAAGTEAHIDLFLLVMYLPDFSSLQMLLLCSFVLRPANSMPSAPACPPHYTEQQQ